MKLKNKIESHIYVYILGGMGAVLALGFLFFTVSAGFLKADAIFISAIILAFWVFAGFGVKNYMEQIIYTTEVENPVLVKNLKEGTTYFLNGETPATYLNLLGKEYHFQVTWESGQKEVIKPSKELVELYISTKQEEI